MRDWIRIDGRTRMEEKQKDSCNVTERGEATAQLCDCNPLVVRLWCALIPIEQNSAY